ncbi:kunitz-type serine protease inhibitor A-like [Ixodes scapularis]|uniref:kunitz-type serine protease inhibitor A-like n=1 Tax=Ixodes scapularis TaxID=6945 RepID=UPI001A9EC84E|nr:kunitz-type serine protease inhibitor A-like [Ixodes scapularis]
MKYMLLVILAATQLVTSNAWSWPGMSKEFCQSVPNRTLSKCDPPRNLVRYHYDKDTKKCKEFKITNCYESGDKFFPSMGDCIEYCRPNQTRGRCWQEPDPGSGSKSLTRWYYNNATNQCATFVYKGTNGNENNFQYRDDCLDYCSYPRQYFNKHKKEIQDLINNYKTGKEEE